ncbi:acyl-CoA dehydrogenase [Nakamurella sp. YIM 132087]|uniref:Acyl-CoA dehydrogenase n=2 Tax=Nakamurella alba TaxID=2665158 RepID=A0A7K1FVL4_9ACTN|nr:acyl-CoA dehydrogenase [Nakamurella alba]
MARDVLSGSAGQGWAELAALGLVGLLIPEEAGGSGGDARDLAVVMEAAGATLSDAPLLSGAFAVAVLAGLPDAADLLPGIADGSLRATLALPQHSSVTLEGDRVTGSAGPVLDPDADLVLLVATDTAGTPVLVCCAGDADGITRTGLTVLDPTRPLVRLDLTDVPARILAREADLDPALAIGSIALAAESVGITDHALRETVAYVTGRQQFGRPIGSFQAVKHRLADLLVELEAARSAVALAAACAVGAPELLPVTAAAAQLTAGNAAALAVKEYVQLHGGIGFTWEHPAHRYVRRVRASAGLFGSAHEIRLQIADLLGLPGGNSHVR